MHKLEKLILEAYGELLYESDGGKLFDYLNTKYHVKDHFHSDNSYMVQRKANSKDQYVIFDFDKDKDQFYIRQLGGYSIDQSAAGEAGMRGMGSSRIAGIDSYYTDGNYSPVEISVDGLKKIVDHVMTGLDREAEAQRAFYADRGPTSGTIDEMSMQQIEKESDGKPLQWEDLTDAQRKSIVQRYGEPKYDGKHDFFSNNMDTYFKAYSKNLETGSLGHRVIKLPSFASLYHGFSDIIRDIKKLMGSDDVRKDQAARELFELIKTNFRKIQRYLRTERPEQYNLLKMQRISELLAGKVNELKSNYINESLIDSLNEEEPTPEEEPDMEAPKETVLEDATDTILSKFPTLKKTIIKLQTEDFKEFVDSIDWISPRPTSFRINLKNGQEYILTWTGVNFKAEIMGKRYFLDKVDDYQQALDKLTILYREGPMKGAGEEGDAADLGGDSGGGGGGEFPGDDAAGGGGEEDLGADDLGGAEGGEEGGGADLTDEPIDFEEPAEEPEA